MVSRVASPSFDTFVMVDARTALPAQMEEQSWPQHMEELALWLPQPLSVMRNS